MSADLKDFRCKITPLAWACVEAEHRATGKDHAEIARDVLQTWAERKHRCAIELVALLEEGDEAAARDEGCVYVIRIGDRFKIGKAIDWKKRIASIQFPEPPEIICVIETASRHRLEQDLHRKYSDLRLHGEWFRLLPEHVEEIRRLPGAQVPA